MTAASGEPAPFRHELSEGPDTGYAVWRKTSDGIRLRIGLWPLDTGTGTVLLFNGRTEFIEKYGRVARDLNAAGYAVATLDWRGQGMSDRLAIDARLGHVGRFSDYQYDVAEVVAAANAAGMPRPFHLIAHSMGGTIGLRALIDGLDVGRAVFSAPMWGIYISPTRRPFARNLARFAGAVGQGLRYTPDTGPQAFLRETNFEANTLTTDPNHYEYMQRQVRNESQFALGGPSLHWLGEALNENLSLFKCTLPDLPVQTYLGTHEEIVDTPAIKRMHRNWPSAELILVAGAKHELMMERPELRSQFMNGVMDFLDAGGEGVAQTKSRSR